MRAAALVGLALAAAGCTSLPREDRAPRRPPDVSGVPDAVPRAEPRSRYGNPPSYEVFGRRYQVLDSAQGYRERGVASWYGEKFHGRRTSSGEPYDMYAMTAAHKSLPLPTFVRVTNIRNGRSVVVRVNDRGPFVHNRIIDLSYTAAARLGILREGTGLVEVVALNESGDPSTPVRLATAPVTSPKADHGEAASAVSPVTAAPSLPEPAATAVAGATEPKEPTEPAETAETQVFVQLGAFADPLNARALVDRLSADGFDAARITADPLEERMVYRVRIGPLAGVPELDDVTARLVSAGFANYHLAYD